jgi:large subunit ribosomal protein L4
MAVVKVKSLEGREMSDLELVDEVFGVPANDALIWESVKHHRAAQRQGTAKTKTRAEVSGSGKKPWRQKGTGRARVGSIRTPLWYHGGTVFGPVPRDYDYAYSKKKKRGALRVALSGKLRDSQLTVVEDFQLASGKTQQFKKILDGLKPGRRVLIVNHDAENANLLRGARNLAHVKLVASSSLNIYDLVLHDGVVFTRDAILSVQETLKK